MTDYAGAMLPLAHLGHWYASMAYAAPALLLGGALAIGTLRERRRRRRAEREQRG